VLFEPFVMLQRVGQEMGRLRILNVGSLWLVDMEHGGQFDGQPPRELEGVHRMPIIERHWNEVVWQVEQ